MGITAFVKFLKIYGKNTAIYKDIETTQGEGHFFADTSSSTLEATTFGRNTRIYGAPCQPAISRSATDSAMASTTLKETMVNVLWVVLSHFFCLKLFKPGQA